MTNTDLFTYLVPFILSLQLVFYGLKALKLYTGKLIFSEKHKKPYQKRYLVQAIICFILSLLFFFSNVFYVSPMHYYHYDFDLPFIILSFSPIGISTLLVMNTVDYYKAYVYNKKNYNRGCYLLVLAIICTILSLLVIFVSAWIYYGVFYCSGLIFYLLGL